MNIRERLWLWGHEANAHLEWWGVTAPSRITPVEAAHYLGVPNLILCDFHGRPEPPFDQHALAMRSLDRTAWSMVGAGGHTSERSRAEVLEVVRREPNVAAVVLDDFFNRNTPDGKPGALPVEELARIKASLTAIRPSMRLWVGLYVHQFGIDVSEHLRYCDAVTFATWRSDDLVHLKRDFETLGRVAPTSAKLMGVYLWDYGQERPMPVDRLARQCDLAARWMREGRLEGVIFVASCVCDLGLEAVEWTRAWVERVGGEKTPE